MLLTCQLLWQLLGELHICNAAKLGPRHGLGSCLPNAPSPAALGIHQAEGLVTWSVASMVVQREGDQERLRNVSNSIIANNGDLVSPISSRFCQGTSSCPGTNFRSLLQARQALCSMSGLMREILLQQGSSNQHSFDCTNKMI